MIEAPPHQVLNTAKSKETDGEPRYVVQGATYNGPGDTPFCWIVTPIMPFIDPWWTSDGIRHG